jgi:hypothetical protein
VHDDQHHQHEHDDACPACVVVLLCQHARNPAGVAVPAGIICSSICECLTQGCVLLLFQDVQAALLRTKEAADAAAAAEAQRYALLQAAKLQESALLQVRLEQVGSPLACRRPATCSVIRSQRADCGQRHEMSSQHSAV